MIRGVLKHLRSTTSVCSGIHPLLTTSASCSETPTFLYLPFYRGVLPNLDSSRNLRRTIVRQRIVEISGNENPTFTTMARWSSSSSRVVSHHPPDRVRPSDGSFGRDDTTTHHLSVPRQDASDDWHRSLNLSSSGLTIPRFYWCRGTRV